jgi:hypothetical protein
MLLFKWFNFVLCLAALATAGLGKWILIIILLRCRLLKLCQVSMDLASLFGMLMRQQLLHPLVVLLLYNTYNGENHLDSHSYFKINCNLYELFQSYKFRQTYFWFSNYQAYRLNFCE